MRRPCEMTGVKGDPARREHPVDFHRDYPGHGEVLKHRVGEDRIEFTLADVFGEPVSVAHQIGIIIAIIIKADILARTGKERPL